MNIKTLKWLGTFFVLVGILLTNLNFYPINIFFSWIWGLCLDFSWLLI